MNPPVLVREEGERSLSGPAMTELLTAVLDRGKAFRFRARGGSMSPFIKDGDVITVSPLRGRRPPRGAVVAFLHPKTGRLAVHRVVGRGPEGVLVRGDNTDVPDGRLPDARILGLVTEVLRDGRRAPLVSGRAASFVAWLSRTGGLVRGLGLMRALRGKGPKGPA
jgi:hypothetical protein